MCLFAACISSLMMDLLRSLSHFYTGLFVFFLSFKRASYVLNNGSLSDVSFASIFSQALAFLPILLRISGMLSVRFLVWFFKNTHNKYMSSSFRLPKTDSQFFWLWLFIDAGLQETRKKTLQTNQNLNHHILLRGCLCVLYRVDKNLFTILFSSLILHPMFDTFLFYNGVASPCDCEKGILK